MISAHNWKNHHQLFAQSTIKVDSGYVNEQDRKPHSALTFAHNITLTVIIKSSSAFPHYLINNGTFNINSSYIFFYKKY